MVMKQLFAVMVPFMFFSSANAQEAGWSYSYALNEGDRATAGCAMGSTPDAYGCVVVRCEDDFSVGVYIDTSRPEGDLGTWHVTVDKLEFAFEVVETDAPYGGRVTGSLDWLLDGLKQGATSYIRPDEGDGLPHSFIPLDGSLLAINEAFYFCAPLVPVGDDSVTEPASPQE